MKIIKTTLIIAGLFLPFFVLAQEPEQEAVFNVDNYYDLHGRQEISTTLVKATDKLHFYADKKWWEDLDSSEKQRLEVSFHNLASEFERKTYPVMTDLFGSEPNPETGIIVLLHPMIAEAGGYFNSGDVYPVIQYPKSNERKILYLNSRHIDKPEADYFLAHEFMHLITANQKDLLRGVVEETWLNEARAEYTATLLGYDEVYRGSNLEKRVSDFLSDPRRSLTEWLNKKEDYGAVNLFIQYLVDHYGVEILVDSLQHRGAGIESINYALKKNNYDKDFSDVFTDWIVALLVNDCNLGERYCYLNENLKSLSINSTIYYLPRAETILSARPSTTYWAPNWYRFVGGQNQLVFEFDGSDRFEFRVPYLICDIKNNCSVEFLELDKSQKGEISFPKFGTDYVSLTAMPFVSSKTIGFNGKETSIDFSWKVIIGVKEEKEADLINQLLARIDSLKTQTAEHKAKISAILSENGQLFSCQSLNNNLFLGMTNSAEVRCLQEFLKSQGPSVYPEGLVTGNFLSLTKTAVVRFQEKYANEILHPLGLQRGTGYVGDSTRIKINQQLVYSIPEGENQMVKELLEKIKELEEEIAKNQAELDALVSENGQLFSCQSLNNNLFLGMTNSAEVRCLQEFLKSQGPSVYPEGLVTGNFLSLTKTAVVRFQEKYANEILHPLGLQRGTGYVGASTRTKINQFLR